MSDQPFIDWWPLRNEDNGRTDNADCRVDTPGVPTETQTRVRLMCAQSFIHRIRCSSHARSISTSFAKRSGRLLNRLANFSRAATMSNAAVILDRSEVATACLPSRRRNLPRLLQRPRNASPSLDL
jgi:hypothetical protein